MISLTAPFTVVSDVAGTSLFIHGSVEQTLATSKISLIILTVQKSKMPCSDLSEVFVEGGKKRLMML